VTASTNRPKAVDLFAGAGGMSLGLEQAGFDVVGAVEYDPVHAATHEFNFPEATTICASVSELSAADLCERIGVPMGELDVVVGGPPCQGFSLIGKRAVEDARNQLVFDFHRLVVGAAAKYFIMENVPGMKIGGQAGLLAELVRHFTESGYRCRPVELLTATDFGVPQLRTRLFLVGARSDVAMPASPVRWTSPTGLELPPCGTVGDALGDLPEVEEYPELLERDFVVAKYGEPSEYAARMRGITRAQDDFSYERVTDSDVLTSSMRTVHTEKSIRRFEATAPGSVEPISRFLRLDPEGYCNTLRAGTDGKRGAYTSPRPIHPWTPRVITVREAARLHSMPDWFRLHSTKWHGFRQVGNAVVPNVGRAVARTLIEALGVRPRVPRRRVALGDPMLLSFTMAEAADYYGVDPGVVGQRDRPGRRT
jgi:DNA (cytosine-5)-methyltransferase 1